MEYKREGKKKKKRNFPFWDSRIGKGKKKIDENRCALSVALFPKIQGT